MQDLTRCVHHPIVSQEGFASLAVPTYRASTIVYPDAKSFSNRSKRGFDGYTYGLHGTPTTRTLEAQLTLLHGGVKTILVPSGQAAASMILLTFLMPGDRVLIPDNVYSPVRYFCQDYLKPRGIMRLPFCWKPSGRSSLWCSRSTSNPSARRCGQSRVTD
jgi:cystathionine beta-lyase